MKQLFKGIDLRLNGYYRTHKFLFLCILLASSSTQARAEQSPSTLQSNQYFDMQTTSTLKIVTAKSGSSNSPWVLFLPAILAKKTSIGSVGGTWTLQYDWECDGSFKYTSTCYIDTKPIPSPNYTYPIIWHLDGDQFFMQDNYDRIFHGTVNSAWNYMSGTMVNDGLDGGCWKATRVN